MLVETPIDKMPSSYSQYAQKESIGRILHYLAVLVPSHVASECKVGPDHSVITYFGETLARYTTAYGFPWFSFNKDRLAYAEKQAQLLDGIAVQQIMAFDKSKKSKVGAAILEYFYIQAKQRRYSMSSACEALYSLVDETLYEGEDFLWLKQNLEIHKGCPFMVNQGPTALSFMANYAFCQKSERLLKSIGVDAPDIPDLSDLPTLGDAFDAKLPAPPELEDS